MPANPCILVLNSGSSSIKFAIFELSTSITRILDGAIENIGKPETTLRVKSLNSDENVSKPMPKLDHEAAVAALIDWIETYSGQETLKAVGHRVVHGGPAYSKPQRITHDMIKALRSFIPFDPEHLPQEILLAETCLYRFPMLTQVACFDTDFHHDLPRVAKILPIPRRFEALGVRRYGFHGLSYAYLMEELVRLDGLKAANGRVILAHLGSGASLAAVCEGKPIDTSMGFTPAAGFPMSTRSGDLDPGLTSYLALTERTTPQQFQHMVNHESGLLGISESSSDLRDLLKIEAHDIRAAEAVEIFCYQIRKWIGSFAAALRGVDTLVFAGGIGENMPVIRARICEGLSFLGIELNSSRNAQAAGKISDDASRVMVRVIRTNEEIMIAKAVMDVLSLKTELTS